MKNAKFTVMLYNQKHLIVKTSENGNPHVIAECFLEQTATLVCELLTAAADADLTLETAHKQK